ncbi:hypothetical protein ACFL5L_03195 [candidate division KSB1 bacterium]
MKTATSIPAEIRKARRDINALTGDVQRVFLQSALIPLFRQGRQVNFDRFSNDLLHVYRRVPVIITSKAGR